MKIALITLLLFQLFLTPHANANDHNTDNKINWYSWSNEAFETAKKENKLVLLDIGAEWCQFCAKMKAVTYKDPEVIKIINQNYIAIYADIDDSEDIKMLYGHFGVPGTIILSPDRDELTKKLGYISPQQMQWHLLGNLQDASDIIGKN